jgi:hypothetical protein
MRSLARSRRVALCEPPERQRRDIVIVQASDHGSSVVPIGEEPGIFEHLLDETELEQEREIHWATPRNSS